MVQRKKNELDLDLYYYILPEKARKRLFLIKQRVTDDEKFSNLSKIRPFF